MRVLMLTDDLQQGGAERQFCMLASGLRGRGHDVLIVQAYRNPVFYSSLLRDVEVITRADGGNPFVRIRNIIGMVRDYLPDIVISFKEGMGMACCLASMISPFRFIVSERNTVDKLSLRMNLKYHLYRRADAVTSNSSAQSRRLKELFPVVGGRCVTIHNAVDFSCLPDCGISCGDRPLILTLARIVPQKNVERWIRTVAAVTRKFPEARFLYVGRHEDEGYCSAMMKLRSRLGLEEVLEFRGETTDISSLLSGASAFVLPSLREGFSNALSEAVAAGLPCAASDAGDNGLIIGDRKRIFDPENEGEICDVVENLLRDLTASYRSEVALASLEKETAERRRKLVTLCSPDEYVSNYENLIAGICGRTP